MNEDFSEQLDALSHDEASFDAECLAPTGSALERTFGLLQEPTLLPKGTIYPDGDGGLRVEWVQGDKQLSLAIHPSDPLRDYLYHQKGVGQRARYEVVPLSDPSILAHWLPWLLLPSADDANAPAA